MNSCYTMYCEIKHYLLFKNLDIGTACIGTKFGVVTMTRFYVTRLRVHTVETRGREDHHLGPIFIGVGQINDALFYSTVLSMHIYFQISYKLH